ncbi:MAG: N-acetylglucosamine-6-phosphate deacetylase [Clostridia bacterium]|nr:N-acetylglucosamine-6-phosphate deacetylase [Clostridia bacterium]
MKAIVNGKLLLKDGMVEGKAILFDEKIAKIVDEKDVQADEIIDAEGLYVSPGFVDVHIHGYLGEDASDGSAEGLRKMAEGILKNGVTSFLPTTMTVAWDELERAFEVIRTLMPESKTWQGAQILGCHAEGPFINPAKKGAQPEDAILPPDADRMLAHKDVIRMATFAPEMPGGIEFAKKIRSESDIVLSVGHTNANYEETMAAFEAGANHATHTFNAMSALSHRSPGTVGAALCCCHAYCELIADTFHVHPGLYKMLHKVKGDKLVIITDCTRAGGLADGEYTLGGQPIFVKGIECRLQDGTIAGSVLKMNDAVRNYRDHAHVPFHEAVNCASLYAARSVGMGDSKGSLEAGKDADIVLLDEECRVHGVFAGGVRKA